MTVFEAIFGEAPKWGDEILIEKGSEVPASRVLATEIIDKRKHLEKLLQTASSTQAKYYDQKHIPKTYNVGDKVLLNAKNIKSTRPSKKLDYKYYVPYEIVSPIGKRAYKLQLFSVIEVYSSCVPCFPIGTL